MFISLSPQWPGHGASAAMPPWPCCRRAAGPPLSPASTRRPRRAPASPSPPTLISPHGNPNPKSSPRPPLTIVAPAGDSGRPKPADAAHCSATSPSPSSPAESSRGRPVRRLRPRLPPHGRRASVEPSINSGRPSSNGCRHQLLLTVPLLPVRGIETGCFGLPSPSSSPPPPAAAAAGKSAVVRPPPIAPSTPTRPG